MKYIITDRTGQISLGLIAIVVGGILVSVMAGVALKGGVTAIEKSQKAQQEATGCSSLNPEQCAADELKKNQEAEAAKKAAEAGIVTPGEQLKDAVAGTPSLPENTPDPTLKEIGLSPIGSIPERLPSQDKEGVLSWFDAPIIQRPWEFLNFVVGGTMSGIETAYDGVKSAYNNFWAPLPIAPIDLESVPSDTQTADNAQEPASANIQPAPAVTPTPISGGTSGGGGGTTEAPKPKPATSGGGTAKPSCFASESFKALVAEYDAQVSAFKTLNAKLKKITIITDANLAAYNQLLGDTDAARTKAMGTLMEVEAAYQEALANADRNLCVADSDIKLCAESYITDLETLGSEALNRTAGACFQ